MKKNHTDFEQFEALLQQKKYLDLSEKERSLVAPYCDSPEEYKLMRQMILASQPIGKAPSTFALENVPNNLLKKVSENSKPSGFQRFVSLRIPFWTFLLSLFTVFGLTYALKSNDVEMKEPTREIPKEIIKEVSKTDTVIQYAYRVDTIYLQSKKSRSTTPDDSKKPALVSHEMKPSKVAVKKSSQHSKGRTIKQDLDLKAFFTDIQ